MTLLQTHDLTARYGDFQALFGVDLALDAGACVAIIGANGAGKSTLLRSIAGLMPNAPDAVLLDGEPVGHLPAPQVLKRGIALAPEGHGLFPSLTVEENVVVGGQVRGPGRGGDGPWDLDAVYDLFPVLRERRANPGTALSGGQQQMVAIGRALMSNPRVLMCDEISLGLAPVVINDIYAALPAIREAGTTMIVVEQDIGRALKVADHAYCMMEGRVTLQGKPDALTREAIHAAYFGGEMAA